MQEELEKKTVVVITTGAKLTERLLKSLIRKALAEMQRQTQNPKVYRGKQSVKHLLQQGGGASTIEVDVYKRQRLLSENLVSVIRGNASEVRALAAGAEQETGVEASADVYKRQIQTITGVAVAPTKPIIGANAFAHEAGIHQHGVMANKERCV